MRPRFDQAAALTFLVVFLSAASGAIATDGQGAKDSQAGKWGEQTLVVIQKSFFMPGSNLYAETTGDGKKPSPSWIWDASIQLGALNAAARIEPAKYLPQVKAYAAALRSY